MRGRTRRAPVELAPDGPTARNQGTVLILALMVTLTLVGLSTLLAGRLLMEQKLGEIQGDSAKALFQAFGEMAKAEAIINTASYDPISGRNAAVEEALAATDHRIGNTSVAIEPISGENGPFFHLVASSRIGRVTRVVRALIRERESFANYNYFVNSHPMGIAGRPTPRGSIHTNRSLWFYFPNGEFIDPVTASEGFDYKAGATAENTTLRGPSDPFAPTVNDLTALDLTEMATQANLYLVDDPAYDVKIVFDGPVTHVEKWTRSHYETQPVFTTYQVQVGTEIQTVIDQVPVYVEETYEEMVDDYEWQDQEYTVSVPVWDTRTVERSREDPVFDTRIVERSREDPIYDTRTVEHSEEVPVYEDQIQIQYTTEQVWVEDDPGEAGGGTDIAGDGTIPPGHWETIQVPHEVTVQVQVGTTTNTWTEEETYISGYQTVTWTEEESYISEYVDEVRTQSVQVLVGSHPETRTRQVLDHVDEVPREVEVPIYESVTEQTGTRQVWVSAALVESQDLTETEGVIYVEGNVTSIKGKLAGRITVVSNGTVNITGNIQYVDDSWRTAYLNGTNPDEPYVPNTAYTGQSVLGVIAKDDIIYRSYVPSNFEINGSLLAKEGRVGIQGIALDSEGNVSLSGSRYVKDSVRRLGGIISNERPVSTYIGQYYEVLAGFRTGVSVYDRRLSVQPPIGFPERMRPKTMAVICREVVN